MSAVNTRNKANTIESIAIPAGAIVVGVCLFGLAKGLSALANAALKATEIKATSAKPQGLKSVAALRAEAAPFKLANSKDNNLENLKAEAFKQLATQPFLVANQAELETSILKLDHAKTLSEFKTIHQAMVAKIENSHQQIFTTALFEASQRAAVQIGFQKIEALPSPLASTVRFAATDALGKTIVTEISAPTGGDARIETEVVGVGDGSCNSILDAFDLALEAEGVRSQPVNRKFTGGACEFAAVSDFLSCKVQPKQENTAQGKDFASTNDAKRRQRLNQKRNEQKQK